MAEAVFQLSAFSIFRLQIGYFAPLLPRFLKTPAPECCNFLTLFYQLSLLKCHNIAAKKGFVLTNHFE
jgi:hypothetical protein